MQMRLEVVGVPVADVDAAIAFYRDQAGFVLDHDVRPAPDVRFVQLTPPGSACSIVLAEGRDFGDPGSLRALQLVVTDLDAAHAELTGRGLSISPIRQLGPEGSPASRFAFFADPDGNAWAVQEIRPR